MKKIIFLLVVVGVIILVVTKDRPSGETTPTPEEGESEVFHPDPSSATFIFEDGPVALKEGRSEVAVGPDSPLKREVLLSDKLAYGDLNVDGKEDAALILVSSGGGSGVFVYVAAYISGPVSYKGTNALFVGDRISPQSLVVTKGIIIFKYLDRGEGEPFAAEPTVEHTQRFGYRSGELEEI